MSTLLERITINPQQCGGLPCIRGIRIRVSDVLDLFAAGLSAEEILAEMPDLEADDLKAALAYAARKLNHPVLVVKFGTSVYQFKNVTGFEVGVIPQNKFPVLLFSILTIFGSLVLFITFSIYSILPGRTLNNSEGFLLFVALGLLALLIAVSMVLGYASQSTKYGLTIFLTSGQKSVFVSQDKSFLMDIVDSLDSFMKEEQAKSLLIDMSNRFITVGGSIHGSAIIGNKK